MELTAIDRGPRIVLLAVAMLVALFAFAGLRLYRAVAGAGDRQTAIRVARTAQARVLGYMLDEETGVRGYGWTGDTLYLEPYRKAQAMMADAFSHLRSALFAIDRPELERIAERQQRRQAMWIATIARPLIRDANRSPTMLELNRRGKATVDDFRNDDHQLAKALDGAALTADRQARAAVRSTLAFVLSALASIALLSGTFGVLQLRAARRAIEAQLRFEDEKRIADALQEAFLNTYLPVVPGVGLHATYVPAHSEARVGGDWYDAFQLADGRLLFSIGDVAGHGIEAAVVMSRARQAIISAALYEHDPAKVLERANASICLQQSRMATAICGYVDPRSLTITYATAGHPPPILARAGEPSHYLPFGGVPLGVLPDAAYRTFVTHAFDGAVLVLYTDGVTEHGRDVLEGERRLLEATRLAVGETDPALAIRRRIFASSEPNDDVAILTISFAERNHEPKRGSVRAATVPQGPDARNDPAANEPPSIPPPSDVASAAAAASRRYCVGASRTTRRPSSPSDATSAS